MRFNVVGREPKRAEVDLHASARLIPALVLREGEKKRESDVKRQSVCGAGSSYLGKNNDH